MTLFVVRSKLPARYKYRTDALSLFLYTHNTYLMLQVSKPKEGHYRPVHSFYLDLVPDNFQLYKLRVNFEELGAFILSLPKDRLD